MRIINNSDSVIIVLHEIYGINQHIKKVCKKFSTAGYDIICPNLIDLNQSFNYDQQEQAYNHFMNKIGFDLAIEQVKQLMIQAKEQYRHVFLLGYSIGATIAWLCSSKDNICDGIIGYYGSRIRDYMNITPNCPALLIFPTEEKSFNVKELVISLRKRNIDVHVLPGKHGFSDPYSGDYCTQSFEKSERLVYNFLNTYERGRLIMNLQENQKEYWNKAADNKEFTTPFQIESFAQFVHQEDKILDVGCGYGRTSNELYSEGYKNLCGIDFSDKMIERGKKQFPWLSLKIKEDKKIPYEDNSFDSIILFAVLTCIVNDDEQISLVNEIKRVLKPNGIIYINDFLLNTDERNIKRYKAYEDKYKRYGVFELPEGAVLRHHDLNWIKSIVSDFNNIKLDIVTYTTMNGNRSNGFVYLGENIK